MKRLLLLLLLIIPLSLAAQIEDARTAIREYRFFDATCILGDIAEDDSLYLEAEPLLREAKVGQASMNAIERVMVIDSVCVPRSRFFEAIPLSAACGTLGKRGYTPNIADRYYSADGRLHVNYFGYNGEGDKVVSSDVLDVGLPDTADLRNPFMLADGLTLYFAARGAESCGGYDIYMTRYDLEERQFLRPQNIGMPFNSPSDDLFYCIDEDAGLGYFVTARRQAPDTVCVYTFIPNAMRRIYDANLYDTEQLASLARIDSLRETWTDAALVLQATARLDSLRSAKPLKPKTAKPVAPFIVSPTLVYHSAADFRSSDARGRYTYYLEGRTDLDRKQRQLAALRQTWRPGQDGTAILNLEQEVAQLADDLTQQEYEIRQLELSTH